MSSIIGNSVPRIQPKRRSAAVEPSESTGTPHELRIASPFVLQATQLYKSYRKGRHEVPVLKGCDFQAVEGQVTAILGHSGSGKSTLLHLLGTLDAPDAGEIYFDGTRIDNLPRKRRDQFRNTNWNDIPVLPSVARDHGPPECTNADDDPTGILQLLA